MDVSIIIPVYNVEDYLSKAIESALNQTYSSFELILVNDGSTDKSGLICDDYQKRDVRIRVIHQKNKGSGPARNAGLDEAKGAYIYFADPDDYFDQTLLEDNIAILKKTEADFLVFGFYEEKRKGSERTEEKNPSFSPTQSVKEFREKFEEYYSFHPYALWNKLYRKSYIDQNSCRFTDQKLGQDALFNLSVIENAGETAVNPKAYYHYIQHEGSAVNRYRKDRFELEMIIAARFAEVMKKWNKEEQYKHLIAKEYWNAVYLELANLSSSQALLSREEKYYRMEDLLKVPAIHQMLHNYPIQDERNQFVVKLVQLLQQQKINQALRLMQWRLSTEARFYPLFSWAKQLFSKS